MLSKVIAFKAISHRIYYLLHRKTTCFCRTSSIVGSDFWNKKIDSSFPCILLNVGLHLKALKVWKKDEPLIRSILVDCRMVSTPNMCQTFKRKVLYGAATFFFVLLCVFCLHSIYIFQVIHSGSVQMHAFLPNSPIVQRVG